MCYLNCLESEESIHYLSQYGMEKKLFIVLKKNLGKLSKNVINKTGKDYLRVT